MLPKEVSIADRLQMARDAGFEEIECPTMPDEHEAEEVKKAAEKSGAAHSFGDEHGALGVSAVVGRSGGGGEERGRHAHQPAQREVLGRRYGAAGAGRGEPANQLSRGLGTVAGTDPQTDSDGAGTEGHHRYRRGVEQVSA